MLIFSIPYFALSGKLSQGLHIQQPITPTSQCLTLKYFSPSYFLDLSFIRYVCMILTGFLHYFGRFEQTIHLCGSRIVDPRIVDPRIVDPRMVDP